MSEPTARDLLRDISSIEMRREIERRECGFEGHPPINYVLDGIGAVVSGTCRCGEAAYEIKRTR